MDERERANRMAKNEALFRDVNERVRQLHGRADTERHEFLCECADGECVETIMLTTDEYERVRADPVQFVFAPGHVSPEVEDVVEENERFAVVQKHPGEQQIARASDPRS